jgi:hypothetical protein
MSDLAIHYPLLASRHKDFFGNIPRRTWFFPPHYHRNGNLIDLVSLCQKGYGEIELHLHHGKTCPDTSENLRRTIEQCLAEYGQFGIFGSEQGRKRYGFIHGDWALDNSLGGHFCGVNDEIQILSETGCYADFTFPSLNASNPKQINSIYYAKDDPDQPKSHSTGHPVCRFGERRGDLMIIQGPLHPLLLDRRFFRLRCLGDAINGNPPVSNMRIDLWVKTGIHIKGKREWIIIKTHTHGATDSEAVLGEEMDSILTHLETMYNDRDNYVLHYVTARELYNIIKSIESGESGDDPEEYRNYRIEAPTYDASPQITEASAILRDLVAKTYA